MPAFTPETSAFFVNTLRQLVPLRSDRTGDVVCVVERTTAGVLGRSDATVRWQEQRGYVERMLGVILRLYCGGGKVAAVGFGQF